MKKSVINVYLSHRPSFGYYNRQNNIYCCRFYYGVEGLFEVYPCSLMISLCNETLFVVLYGPLWIFFYAKHPCNSEYIHLRLVGDKESGVISFKSTNFFLHSLCLVKRCECLLGANGFLVMKKISSGYHGLLFLRDTWFQLCYHQMCVGRQNWLYGKQLNALMSRYRISLLFWIGSRSFRYKNLSKWS